MRIGGVLLLVVGLLALAGGDAWGQTFRRGGAEFDAYRAVDVPADKSYSVVVTEFFHHGLIKPDAAKPDTTGVLVSSKAKRTVPSRILQLGPGDFCRLAFQTVKGQSNYEIYYGIDPAAKPQDPPPWTSRDGLLLETRHYKECNLNSLDSVRQAFKAAKPIGADYVPSVSHSGNPLSMKQEPFFSHYSGYLHVPSTGLYGFLLSSQDCSFLLIDDKLVIDAPGRHGPLRRATRGTRKDVKLTAGPHKFDYYHAAIGPEAMMVAAWEIAPSDPKPKPSAIPGEAFRTGSIGRLSAGPVKMRITKLVPDFLVKIAGDVPLPDFDIPPQPEDAAPLPYTGTPLIGVMLQNRSAGALTLKAKIGWDFGDGQTADTADAVHVYLRPGVYNVKLTVKRGSRALEMANRVNIDRPRLTRADKDKLHNLDDYLKLLDTYNPRALDAESLLQLVRAYQWKSDLLAAPKSDEEKAQEAGRRAKNKDGKVEEQPPETAEQIAEQLAAREAESLAFITKAVEAGKVAFIEETAAAGDLPLLKLARAIGPTARDRLGDAKLAFRIWQGAARKINDAGLKAECEMQTADIAISDAVNPTAAKQYLENATTHFGKGRTGALASRLQRIRGDYHALTGDGKAARADYARAEEALDASRAHTERTAWQGAYSRSAEQFLKSGEWARAVEQIRLWQQEFPIKKIDGYLTLCYARYFAGREQYAQAIAQSEQLLAVNPDSPYIDQLLLLAAECEVKRDKLDRALATLESLLKDYPGSPLVPVVRKRLAELKTTPKPPRSQP